MIVTNLKRFSQEILKVDKMISLDIGQLAHGRKTPKKGLELNIMLVGENGMGKSTLINTLLNNKIVEPDIIDPKETVKPVTIKTTAVDLDDRQTKIRLSLIQVVGFGDSLDNSCAIQPVVDYIDAQLSNYLQDESGLNRRSIVDNRVHCCLYFLPPDHKGLRMLDIQFMKAIHNKVNLFPLLAKADSYTNQELASTKQKIIKDLNENAIKIYEFPECDTDDDPEFTKINNEMKKLVPFSVIGGLDAVNVAGKTLRGRKYPWGFVNVDDPLNSDFIYLRKMLFRSHTHDLRDITNEIHYENFRAQVLTSPTNAMNVLDSFQPLSPEFKFNGGLNQQPDKSSFADEEI